MPAPTGVWHTSRSSIRASIGGSAVVAYPSWFYTGATVVFGHMPPRKGAGRRS